MIFATYRFKAPLRIRKSKNKDFILNLNNYRNAHYMVLNNSKRAFVKYMDQQYPSNYLPLPEVKTRYTVFAATKRKFDLPNVCSIVQKYFEDWMVGRGIIETDDITVVSECEYLFGGVDTEDPRVEVEVISI